MPGGVLPYQKEFLSPSTKKYLDSLEGKKVHSGYFSIDKKASKGLKDDELVFIDSKIDSNEIVKVKITNREDLVLKGYKVD